MVGLRITVQGEQSMRALFRGVTDITSDLSRYWPAVVDEVYAIEQEAFSSEGSSTRDGRWTALDPTYAAQKARLFPGKRILERTGALRDSLTGGPGGRVTMRPMSLLIESQVPYGSFHQEGDGLIRRAPWLPTDRNVFRIADVIAKGMRRDLAKLAAA